MCPVGTGSAELFLTPVSEHRRNVMSDNFMHCTFIVYKVESHTWRSKEQWRMF